MTNEQYLITSYFIICIISLGFAIVTYLWLRNSFTGILQSSPDNRLFQIIRKIFLPGIVFPALYGFLSVSFRSCSRDTYDKIIEGKAYLIAKNQEQLSTSLFYIVIALLVWGFIIGGTILINKTHKMKKSN